jgi:hypothetical protein
MKDKNHSDSQMIVQKAKNGKTFKLVIKIFITALEMNQALKRNKLRMLLIRSKNTSMLKTRIKFRVSRNKIITKIKICKASSPCLEKTPSGF